MEDTTPIKPGLVNNQLSIHLSNLPWGVVAARFKLLSWQYPCKDNKTQDCSMTCQFSDRVRQELVWQLAASVQNEVSAENNQHQGNKQCREA